MPKKFSTGRGNTFTGSLIFKKMNGRTDEENNFNQQALKNLLIEDIEKMNIEISRIGNRVFVINLVT